MLNYANSKDLFFPFHFHFNLHKHKATYSLPRITIIMESLFILLLLLFTQISVATETEQKRLLCVLASECDDHNACTYDTCVLSICVYTYAAAGAPCEDGLFCTAGDQCNGGGSCVGRDCLDFLITTSQQEHNPNVLENAILTTTKPQRLASLQLELLAMMACGAME